MIVSLEQQASVIQRWKEANGVLGRDYVPANGGKQRTSEKRGLLTAIGEASASRGVKPPFKANY